MGLLLNFLTYDRSSAHPVLHAIERFGDEDTYNPPVDFEIFEAMIVNDAEQPVLDSTLVQEKHKLLGGIHLTYATEPP